MVTNASNQTQYFGFPLFASTDKPSWVTDWNGTVEELDTLLETLRVRISSNESAISALERRVTDIGAEIAEMANTLAVQSTAITDNKSQIDILRETLVEVSATVKSLVNANLETRMATVESSVSHVESELGRVSDSLAELSHTVTTQGTDIDTLQEDLGTLTGRVGTISDDLDAAENDIDALENRADRQDVADTRILDTLASNVIEQGVTHAREWTEGTSYVKGDFIQVPKQGVFVCVAGHTATASNKPSINETIHSVVNSQYWTSLAMWLRRMFSKIISEYQTTTEYKKDEYVTYNNNVYKAKSTNTGNLPTDADYWEAVPNLSDGGFCNAIFRKVLSLATDVSDMQTEIENVQSGLADAQSDIARLSKSLSPYRPQSYQITATDSLTRTFRYFFNTFPQDKEVPSKILAICGESFASVSSFYGEDINMETLGVGVANATLVHNNKAYDIVVKKIIIKSCGTQMFFRIELESENIPFVREALPETLFTIRFNEYFDSLVGGVYSSSTSNGNIFLASDSDGLKPHLSLFLSRCLYVSANPSDPDVKIGNVNFEFA